MNLPAILERLDLHARDGTRTVAAADLLGRAQLANIGRSDDGVPAAGLTADQPGGADLGLRPGFYADKMRELSDLATEAMRRGVDIEWR